jgi:hypothetical protein
MCLRVSFLTRCFYYVKKIQPFIRIDSRVYRHDLK